ncbi:MazG nucleotide pyrophosphohydrolase domain-containing protein [Brevibacillus sp. GCM10020057]|uniref:MazG nucleotide pyrophosphohydrolase domain-containing protein n=1 Tax=Brevibacillus sp. GCM10020057 TaxID=3317327 RepID=UPI0036382747
MKENMTIKTLQSYIKHKDFRPEHKQAYFLKLVEEIGELSEVIRKNLRMDESQNIKGTIEDELYDVLYYTLALANLYDIDLEQCHYLKDEINLKKYGAVRTQS